MRMILISGIPGTGKTTVGDYLRDQKGFVHFNLEDPNLDQQVFLQAITEKKNDFVITWGFGPDIPEHISLLKMILDQGAKMIWFDGNREAAEIAFKKRGTVGDDLHVMQMERINRTNIVADYQPIVIDTFDKNGKFIDVKDTAEKILNAIS